MEPTFTHDALEWRFDTLRAPPTGPWPIVAAVLLVLAVPFGVVAFVASAGLPPPVVMALIRVFGVLLASFAGLLAALTTASPLELRADPAGIELRRGMFRRTVRCGWPSVGRVEVD